MTLTIKKVNSKLPNYTEIIELMKNAFPKNEQFPIWQLRLLACKKCVSFSAYYDGELFAGISYTAASDNMVFILFLAVNPNVRSKGYGSAILEHIKDSNIGKTITLNIEPPNPNAENHEQRNARLSFYERNGYAVTKYIIKDKGENYIILSSIPKYSVDDFKKTIKKMSYGLYKAEIYEDN